MTGSTLANKGLQNRTVLRFRNFFISGAAVIVLLAIWWAAAVLMDASIILPPPPAVIRELLGLLQSNDFWISVWSTLIRGLAGFFISLLVGTVVGIAAGISLPLHALFKPLIAIIRTTPIMSVILIALLWFKTGTVPIFSSFLIAFPVITQNIIVGIRQTDQKLLQMGRAYGLDSARRLLHISIPSVVPYLISGAQTALGLTWKVVVAAEVSSLPNWGVGSEMQFSQMSLETAQVFAWTAVAILLSAGSQWLLSLGIHSMSWSRLYADSM
ncbi:MAG: ABC transporter permease subunit [Spirochaetia bacterium]|nr:ABC transporter permease subunit [Spirochaetia bacterium]